MSNNKNVTKFHVLLRKIIVTSAKDSSALCIIDKIIVSLMCTLGPYTYVSICMHPWSYYGLCQCLLEELGICGMQNSSVHQDLLIKISLLLDIFFTPKFLFYCGHTTTLNFSFLLLWQCAFFSLPPAWPLFPIILSKWKLPMGSSWMCLVMVAVSSSKWTQITTAKG